MERKFLSLLCVLLIVSCQQTSDTDGDVIPPLFIPPVTVELNLKEGYRVNKVTGDSIPQLNNYLGDTVKTGIPTLVKGVKTFPRTAAPPLQITTNQPVVIPLQENVQLFSDTLHSITVDINALTKHEPSVNADSVLLFNAYGDTIQIGVPIDINEVYQPWAHPKPVPAIAPRLRDFSAYNIQYLDIEQGMQSSTVKSIIEDKSGNMWLGTDVSVSRFDGAHFRHFIDKAARINSTSNMIVDSRSNLWFATSGGIICITEEGFIWLSEQKKQLYTDGINSIMEDTNGNIWFGTWNGVVIKYQPGDTLGKGQLTHYLLLKSPSPGMVSGIIEDEGGNIWFSTTRDGVFRYNGKSFGQLTEAEGLPRNGVWDIYKDKAGSLWMGISGGACRLVLDKKGHSGTLTNFTVGNDLAAKVVRSVCSDKYGNIWIGTWGAGVYKLTGIQSESGSQRSVTRYSDKEGLSNNLVMTLYEDSESNIWIGTAGGGVNIINNNSFEHFTEFKDINNLLIRPIFEDKKGNIWFGTEGPGISKIDFGINGNPTALRYYTSTDPFVIRWTSDIAQDYEGTLWFGSTEGMMRLAGEEDGKLQFQHYSGEQGFTEAWATCIKQDRKGNMWFGTYGGGLICGRASSDGTFDEFIHFTEDQGFSCNYITDIVEDKKGNLWVSTDINGICYFDISENAEEGTMTVYSEKEGLLCHKINDFFQDEADNLWIATEYAGVCKFYVPSSGNDGFCTAYTNKQGLTENVVRSVYPVYDATGNLQVWAGTPNGINLLQTNQQDKSRSGIITFGKAEGLKRTDFSYKSVQSDSRGFLWWGSGKGLQRLPLKTFSRKSIVPTPIVRQLDINAKFIGYSTLTDSLSNAVRFKDVASFENIPLSPSLSYKNNHLTFHFSAIDWSAPNKIQYSYKIHGLNDTWSIPSRETKADYRNLPYGTHTFKVRAIGESQQWSEPTLYSFTIRPPWWLSWWAYLGYVMIGGSAINKWHRSRLNRKLEIAEKKRLQELDEYKNKLYTNITHEFRSPLTLIHGPVTNALHTGKTLEVKELSSIHRQSARLQQLINQMLDLQKIEAGKMKVHYKHGDIVQHVRSICNMFDSWAHEKRINLSMIADPEEMYMDFDEEKLTQIISNLLSNAIKHTPESGNVTVSLQHLSTHNIFQLIVQDTGVGISSEDLPFIFDRYYQSSRAAAGGTGIGMALTKSLVDLLKGSITVESKLDAGTLFRVSLPVTKQATYIAPEVIRIPDPVRMESFYEEPATVVSTDAKPDKPIVLVVEDHHEVMQYIASCLADEYNIITAPDGVEGLRKAFEYIPDLVISDVMMPRKDGFELCATLKTDIQTSHIPVILLTGRGDHPALMSGIEQGADAYVVKPFDPAELQLRVKKLLELRANLSQHYRKHATTRDVGTHVQASPKENEFLKNIRGFVEEHMTDAQFNMDMLCHYAAMSHPQLHRKITALTGESTGKFVREVRLSRACELLRQSVMTISEIAYETGFSDPGYFTKVFSKEYGVSPSEFRVKGLNS